MSTLPNGMFVHCATTEMRMLSQGFPEWRWSTVDISVHATLSVPLSHHAGRLGVFYETSPPPCLCLHQWRPRSDCILHHTLCMDTLYVTSHICYIQYTLVKDSQHNCAYKMWGFFTCTRDMMEYQLLVDCLIPLWNGKGLYGTSHHVLDTV